MNFFFEKLNFLNKLALNKSHQIIFPRIEAREKQADAVRAINVHKNTVYKAWKAYKESGTCNLKKPTGRSKYETRIAGVGTIKARTPMSV